MRKAAGLQLHNIVEIYDPDTLLNKLLDIIINLCIDKYASVRESAAEGAGVAALRILE